jgi:hypothetical protein
VALAYLAGAVLSWQSFGAGLGPAFFPPAGVTVAAMLMTPRSRWQSSPPRRRRELAVISTMALAYPLRLDIRCQLG